MRYINKKSKPISQIIEESINKRKKLIENTNNTIKLFEEEYSRYKMGLSLGYYYNFYRNFVGRLFVAHLISTNEPSEFCIEKVLNHFILKDKQILNNIIKVIKNDYTGYKYLLEKYEKYLAIL